MRNTIHPELPTSTTTSHVDSQSNIYILLIKTTMYHNTVAQIHKHRTKQIRQSQHTHTHTHHPSTLTGSALTYLIENRQYQTSSSERCEAHAKNGRLRHGQDDGYM